jgi:FkbH-like protein
MTPAPTSPKPAALVAVSATFTAELLTDTLRFWLDRLGMDLAVRFAPYNQVFQQLLDPSSLLAQNRGGVNVVLARLEDWVRFQEAASASLDSLEENARHLVACLRAAAESFPSPLIVAVCPCSPGFLADPGRAAFAARITEYIESSLSSVCVITEAELDRLYPVAARHDSHGDELGHIPYTLDYFTALATLIARKVHALRMPPYKVLVLDCDDTLWQGICGEDGPEDVVIDPPRQALQEFALRQHDSGMLLCLCSRNNMEDVMETFRFHPEMPLRLEHFVARRINWTAKPANLASLAEELQLGLDSFIFIDDNPQECAEVEARRPEVLTLPLPSHSREIPEFLAHVWAFDRIQITDEDKRRTRHYSQRIERAQLEEFTESLRLEIRISPLAPGQLPRVAQLTQRTNQMNFTAVRRTQAEVQVLLGRGGAECLVVEVSDRFGSYGLTGVAIYEVDADALRVDTFLLSCRVLGRGVEHRLLARLAEIAGARGLGRVDVRFSPTQRNQPALMFLESVGAEFKQPARPCLFFRFPATYAATIAYQPAGAVSRQPAEAPAGETVASEPIDFHYIASSLRSVDQIRERVRGGNRSGAARAAAPAAPRTQIERQLVALWAELLGIPEVGVHDNFFDLGGHSLAAVQLVSRVRRLYQVDLSLDVVYSAAFTVAELATAIEMRLMEQADPIQYADLVAEIEALSDEEVRDLLDRETDAPGR